jgi:uncharacterized Zn finger protein
VIGNDVAFGEYDEFPAYVSAAERRLRAARLLKALAKRGLAPKPIVVEGREIARTFWGKAWCDHLESHADLANRLPRGRTYVRNGSVLDLKISRGEVRAWVSGTEAYEATVRLEPLAPERWDAVRSACAGRIATAVELLAGRLSAAVMEVLCHRERGLFPATAELELKCSCPDGAWLCKHLAAVLYGVGARLDEAPELLFTLRGVDLEELVAAAGDVGSLTGGAAAGATLADEHLAEIFGIELESGTAPLAAPGRRTERKPPPKRAAKKASRRSASRPRRRPARSRSR